METMTRCLSALSVFFVYACLVPTAVVGYRVQTASNNVANESGLDTADTQRLAVNQTHLATGFGRRSDTRDMSFTNGSGALMAKAHSRQREAEQPRRVQVATVRDAPPRRTRTVVVRHYPPPRTYHVGVYHHGHYGPRSPFVSLIGLLVVILFLGMFCCWVFIDSFCSWGDDTNVVIHHRYEPYQEEVVVVHHYY
eukprot:TRINITY_DN11285_c0_g1_i1.p1 TRINITY_DN11285_c0_g1~~TRINITY_DN11285_c0_g1_i1.p1  ORF type:complete len:207 (+),score=7.27 TRINITY_DN11285_c0_g1_i1:37-621(+)